MPCCELRSSRVKNLLHTCTLPEGVVPAPRRNLLPFKSIELPVPSKVAIIGFLASWAVAAFLIYAVYLIITI